MGSELARRGSEMASMISAGGGSSLRSKLTSGIKNKMLRRMTTRRETLDRKMGAERDIGDVIEEVKDDETELEKVLDTVADEDMSEALEHRYDVVGAANETNQYH